MRCRMSPVRVRPSRPLLLLSQDRLDSAELTHPVSFDYQRRLPNWEKKRLLKPSDQRKRRAIVPNRGIGTKRLSFNL